jgi:hypothetical protein
LPAPKEKDKNKVLDESMQRAYQKVSGEMPNVKPISVSPSNSSLLTKVFTPRGANAVSNPFTGNMTYNPSMINDMGYSQFDKEQILAHEMTHTAQTQDMPWYKKLGDIFGQQTNELMHNTVPKEISENSVLNNPYYWRPHEQEAYQAERDRATRLHTPNYVDPIFGTRDIQLYPERNKTIDTGPTSQMLKKKVK